MDIGSILLFAKSICDAASGYHQWSPFVVKRLPSIVGADSNYSALAFMHAHMATRSDQLFNAQTALEISKHPSNKFLSAIR